MPRPIDFHALQALFPPLPVLLAHGWEPVARGTEVARGPCPWHRSTNTHSRSLSVGHRMAYCHKCRRHGDAVALHALFTGKGMYEAAIDLCRIHGVDPPYIAHSYPL